MYRGHKCIGEVALIVGVVAGGCNGQPAHGQVEGTVRVEGKPLCGVQVLFYPDARGQRSVGFTDQQGHYRIATEAIQGQPSREGAALGNYRVVLSEMPRSRTANAGAAGVKTGKRSAEVDGASTGDESMNAPPSEG